MFTVGVFITSQLAFLLSVCWILQFNITFGCIYPPAVFAYLWRPGAVSPWRPHGPDAFRWNPRRMTQRPRLIDMSRHLKSAAQGQSPRRPKEVNFQQAGMSDPRHIDQSARFCAVVVFPLHFFKKINNKNRGNVTRKDKDVCHFKCVFRSVSELRFSLSLQLLATALQRPQHPRDMPGSSNRNRACQHGESWKQHLPKWVHIQSFPRLEWLCKSYFLWHHLALAHICVCHWGRVQQACSTTTWFSSGSSSQIKSWSSDISKPFRFFYFFIFGGQVPT